MTDWEYHMRLWGREDGAERLVNLLRAREELPTQMILSLAEVERFDSLGIGALARALVECTKRQIDLKVVLPTGVPGTVLRLLHILDPWPAFPDETSAIRAFLGAGRHRLRHAA